MDRVATLPTLIRYQSVDYQCIPFGLFISQQFLLWKIRPIGVIRVPIVSTFFKAEMAVYFDSTT
jgi:hypothetical protein